MPKELRAKAFPRPGRSNGSPEEVADASDAANQATETSTGKFFGLADWITLWLTSLLTFIVYFATLAPAVTLEDSGELAVAADYLGVPHPPGYPIWTILAWVFTKIFAFKTYMGQPNPAWSVGLMSAFFGALACGVTAMLIGRSGATLMDHFKIGDQEIPAARKTQIRVGAGVAAGLVLALTPVLWSQSVIVEVYSLNAFFAAVILLLTYVWIHRPQDARLLYCAAFIFGIGMTNHQTLLLMAPGLACAMFVRDRKLFCTMAICGGAIVVTTWIFKHYGILFEWTAAGKYPALLENIYRALPLDPKLSPPAKGLHNPGLLMFVILVVTYMALTVRFLPDGRKCAIAISLVWVGLAFYIYLPLSSETNPPMNWGYPRTWDGFVHAITRGQYEKIKAGDVFTFRFLQQMGMYFEDLRKQFTLPTALLGFLPFSLWSMTFRGRRLHAIYATVGLWALAAVFTQVEQLVPGATVSAAYKGMALLIVGVAYVGLVILVTNLVEEMIHQALGRRDANLLERIIMGGAGAILVPGSIYVTVKILGMAINDKALPVGLALAIPVLVILAWVTVGAVVWLRNSPLNLKFDADVNQERWLLTALISFIGVSFVLILLQQPKGDIQDLFIKRVQYIQSHAVYVIWVGYGLIFALSAVALLLRSQVMFLGLAAAALVTAVVTPYYRNYHDHELLKAYGGCEQNGHDYGWQFGNYQLRGMEAILEELKEGERPPPNPNFPPPMGPDAFFFGGTDPGRFVPTYMIYSALVRPDVFLITQNALADHTYMSVMRDLYGDDIWIPSVHESNLAFQRYVQEVRDGTRTPNAQLKVDNGRVQVTGVQGVMEINGILAEMMFEHNKFKHDFYVEESYVIPWMYPYMEPHGLILKVNKEKLKELSPEVVKNDMQFWSWYTRRLLSDDAFVRDVVARKSFSKLRSAIAGLYAYRRMFKEAEIAFKQSLRLYDLSPEANFRLTEVYRQQMRFKDAIELTRRFCAKDPGNRQSASILQRMTAQQDRFSRMRELEVQTRKQAPLQDVLELMALYREFNPGLFRQYAQNLLSNDQVHPNVYLEVAKLFEQVNQWPAAVQAIERYIGREKKNPKVWLRLATAALSVKPKNREQAVQLRDRALEALGEAVKRGGDPYRGIIAKEQTFVQAFSKDSRFHALMRRPGQATANPPKAPTFEDFPMN